MDTIYIVDTKIIGYFLGKPEDDPAVIAFYEQYLDRVTEIFRNTAKEFMEDMGIEDSEDIFEKLKDLDLSNADAIMDHEVLSSPAFNELFGTRQNAYNEKVYKAMGQRMTQEQKDTLNNYIARLQMEIDKDFLETKMMILDELDKKEEELKNKPEEFELPPVYDDELNSSNIRSELETHEVEIPHEISNNETSHVDSQTEQPQVEEGVVGSTENNFLSEATFNQEVQAVENPPVANNEDNSDGQVAENPSSN